MDSLLFTLASGAEKWLKVSETLKPGQLEVMGSLEDIFKRGRYKVRRIE